MIQSGAFTENDRLELIEGWVVQKMAKGAAHEFSTGQAEELVRALLPAGWHVRNQAPITLARSEPEPDLTIVRGNRAEYRDHHPQATDVALVIEVSDTTLSTDRLKAKMYAAAGIPEYWIINLEAGAVEVHGAPAVVQGEGAYREQKALREGNSVPLIIGGHDCGGIPVASMLP
jgi:Uma2 family endonuclease